MAVATNVMFFLVLAVVVLYLLFIVIFVTLTSEWIWYTTSLLDTPDNIVASFVTANFFTITKVEWWLTFFLITSLLSFIVYVAITQIASLWLLIIPLNALIFFLINYQSNRNLKRKALPPAKDRLNVKVLMDFSKSNEWGADYRQIVHLLKNFRGKIVKENNWNGYHITSDEFIQALITGTKQTTKLKTIGTQTDPSDAHENIVLDPQSSSSSQNNEISESQETFCPAIEGCSPPLFSEPLI